MRTGSSGVQMKSSPACCMLLPTNHDRGTFEWSRVGRVSKRNTHVEATRKQKQGKGRSGLILKEAKQPWGHTRCRTLSSKRWIS